MTVEIRSGGSAEDVNEVVRINGAVFEPEHGLAWVTVLATVVAVMRRAAGERAIRTADAIAGTGLLCFGGALAYGSLRSD